jgi:glycosyltransferase involved in cell wall biosynthesis
MRVLIATGLYPPETGGPATYSRLLEKELPKHGLDVAVLPFSEVRELPPGIRHVVYFFKTLFRGSRADVIYALDPVSVGLPASLAALCLRKKFLLRVAGDYAWEQGRQRFGVRDELDEFQHKRYGRRVELLRRVQRLVARRAEKIVVPSDYMRGVVSTWIDNPAKIQTIYSSIRMPVAYEPPQERAGGFLIVTVARLVPWKGVDGLIRVVAKQKNWQLVVIDDGPERKNLETLAYGLGAADRVQFLGSLPHAQAMGWIKAADSFALNSTYEGLSHLLIEAMSLSTPVVATNIGGNPELIANGSEGLIVPPKDDRALLKALQSIEGHPDEARARAIRASERVKQFSIEVTIEKLCELLAHI